METVKVSDMNPVDIGASNASEMPKASSFVYRVHFFLHKFHAG